MTQSCGPNPILALAKAPHEHNILTLKFDKLSILRKALSVPHFFLSDVLLNLTNNILTRLRVDENVLIESNNGLFKKYSYIILKIQRYKTELWMNST